MGSGTQLAEPEATREAPPMTTTAPLTGRTPGTEPLVRAKDVAYARFSAPDLDLMQGFVEDFGLNVVHRDDDILISRGLEASPYLHVVHRGPAKFMGFAFELDSDDDLQQLANNIPGCSPVHDIPGPEGALGGGRRVHFVDPISGFVLEAVHGQQADPLQPRRGRITYNHAGVDERLGDTQDVAGNRRPNSADPGPPEIRRLGHCVVSLPVGPHQNFMKFLANTFGMLISEAAEINVPPGGEHHVPPQLFEALQKCDSTVMAQFMRMDRGEEYTDHHSVFVLPLMDPRAAMLDGSGLHAQLSHLAFEVFSMDDVFRGHMSLRARQAEGKPYALAWGVGRHVYGSQVYDYWHDPYGHVHEHMCDGDRVDSSYGPNIYDLNTLGPNGANQWGPTVSESGVFNLDGPQCAPHFADLPEEIRADLLSRHTTDMQHILDGL